MRNDVLSDRIVKSVELHAEDDTHMLTKIAVAFTDGTQMTITPTGENAHLYMLIECSDSAPAREIYYYG